MVLASTKQRYFSISSFLIFFSLFIIFNAFSVSIFLSLFILVSNFQIPCLLRNLSFEFTNFSVTVSHCVFCVRDLVYCFLVCVCNYLLKFVKIR
jgi:hypothetical protein